MGKRHSKKDTDTDKDKDTRYRFPRLTWPSLVCLFAEWCRLWLRLVPGVILAVGALRIP